MTGDQVTVRIPGAPMAESPLYLYYYGGLPPHRPARRTVRARRVARAIGRVGQCAVLTALTTVIAQLRGVL